MSANGPSWDDTEFSDGSSSGGFKSPDASQPEAGGRRRIHTEPPVAPYAEQATGPRTDRRRSPTLMIGAMALALIVLIVAIGGSLIYFQSKPSIEDIAFRPIDTYTSSASSSSTSSTSSTHVDTTTQAVAPPDSILATDHVVASAEHQPAAVSALYGEMRPVEKASDPAPRATPKPTQTPSPVTKPDTRPAPAPAPKPTRVQAPTTTTSDAAAVYVVQVFSSPSRQDADEWLKRLEQQQVSDAYLTEQELKGETWYRVRFGRFSSRVEAEAEALRRGFRQPWIARVR